MKYTAYDFLFKRIPKGLKDEELDILYECLDALTFDGDTPPPFNRIAVDVYLDSLGYHSGTPTERELHAWEIIRSVDKLDENPFDIMRRARISG
jgi:hypothetical protein